MGDKDTIPALERAIELVKAMAGGMHHHSIAELSRQLGIPATSCYRVVRTLVDADWLRPRGRGAGYELLFGLTPLAQTVRIITGVDPRRRAVRGHAG